MDNLKKANKKQVDRLILQHEEIVNQEIKDTKSPFPFEEEQITQNILTIDRLKEWLERDYKRIKANGQFYEDKMFYLYRLILALTDERFILSDAIRLGYLEYLLEELSEIFMDIMKFVQLAQA